MKRLLRDFLYRLEMLFSKSRILTAFYYFALNRSFDREKLSVINAKIAYRKRLNGNVESDPLLRRNVHRIEKGLIMVPRRGAFAGGYIKETVDAFIRLKSSKQGDCDELAWAKSVLSEYFHVTDQTDLRINQCRERFLASIRDTDDENEDKKPYVRDLSKGSPVRYEDLLELAKIRRSVRWYEQRRVPRELVDNAIVVAGFSPSACNRQPYKFLIFDNADDIMKVANIPMGTTGFAHNFPGIIVVVGDLSNYFSERDRHVVYIDASLASMALVFALEAQGVSSCCINWPDLEHKEKEMEKLLDLKPYERVVMLISYGYPDKERMVPYSQKKPLKLVRDYRSGL